MKKKLFKGIIASALLCSTLGALSTMLTACPSVVENYNEIKVTATKGVEYTLDKTSAKPGETVTLEITKLPNGSTIKTVALNGTKLEAGADGKYTFTMPNGEASLVITASVKEEFAINVSCPSTVTYELSHTKAVKDTVVTLTIGALPAGVSIKEVKMNTTSLEKPADGKTYTFVMPNRSVTIEISLTISGDLVIDGDIVAELTPTGTPGLYAAKGVRAEGIKGTSSFNWAITKDGVKTVCDVLSLDETKSFADIKMNTATNAEYKFTVTNGFLYDFYYDENNGSTPCYIQRSGIIDLPTSVGQVEALMITAPSVRSEFAIFPENYVGAHYECVDYSPNIDPVNQVYDWALYENNVSFAKITDKIEIDDNERYVYKKYDEAANIYETVDTYAMKKGKSTVNDDRYRLQNNNYGEVAGRFNVIDGDDYGHRYDVSKKHAIRNVRASSHMPNYLVEREIMDAYRVGYSTDNGATAFDIAVTSSLGDNNSVNVNINSFIEYDSSKSGTVSSSTVQEAFKYTVKLVFNAKSELTSLTYTQKHFSAEEWDFTTHDAMLNKKGTTRKNVKASYTYGDPISGTPDFGDFNKNDYFISELNNIQFYDPDTNRVEDRDAGKSVLAISDRFCLFDTYKGDFDQYCYKKVFFSPATALDYWQYNAVSSSNEEVAQRTIYNAAYEMTALNEGKTTLTFDNRVPGTGATATVEVEVVAAALVRNYYIDWHDSDPITTSNSADVKAGGTYTFNIQRSPAKSACKYHPVSSNPSLLKVTSADNAQFLTIDCSGALDIKTNTAVTVTLEGVYEDNKAPTVLTFTILPPDINPLGTWVTPDDVQYKNTVIQFTDEIYTGTTSASMAGALVGTITYDYYANDRLASSDEFTFIYKFDTGVLIAEVVAVSSTDGEMSKTNPSQWRLWFYYESSENSYGVFLGLEEYDTDVEFYWYEPVVIGSWDYTNPEVFGYTKFTLKAD